MTATAVMIATLADDDRDEFAACECHVLLEMSGALPRQISREVSALRSPKPLPGGWYYESNHSPDTIPRVFRQVTQLAGLSAEEWWVELA